MQPITRVFIEIVSNLIALAVAVAIIGYWFHLPNDSFSNGAIIATMSYIAAYIGWKLYSRSAGRKRKETGSTSTTREGVPAAPVLQSSTQAQYDSVGGFAFGGG